MQAATLLVVYVLSIITIQFVGFLISRMVDSQFPAFGLMTFLILFMAAFGLAWPVAVLVAEWLIRRMGLVVETEQSGVDTRRDIARKRPAQV